MAKVVPEGWRELKASGIHSPEIDTLALLAEGLGDTYTVYHSVHWSRVNGYNGLSVGEIDFIIVGPGPRVLLIEQKNGFLNETSDGLTKTYINEEKSVPMQLNRNRDNFTNRLRKLPKGESIGVDALLYCPDHRLRLPGTAGVDPRRIVDSTRRRELLAIIREILPTEGDLIPEHAPIHHFIGELFDLIPNVNANVDGVHRLQTRLSGGLAHWGRRVEMSPFRLRVVGTAGSGKTQLAMAVYADALRRVETVLYVCFNRPLADHIGVIAPPGGTTTSYHHLADRVYRQQHGTAPDFTADGVYTRLEEAMTAYAPADDELVDTLIVDEGQDFQPEWADNLLRFLKPHGKAWWLEDPMQKLYQRDPVLLEGWVRLRADINYRSPREIVRFVNRLLPREEQVQSGSPLVDAPVDFITYGEGELLGKTRSAVFKCRNEGFKSTQIAIGTCRGWSSSVFNRLDELGNLKLKSPTGAYDLLGNALYSEGELIIDSVHRFKGRAAPCVILTEMDFEALTDETIRRIFVGATRATMKLVCVVSERTAGQLYERIAQSASILRS